MTLFATAALAIVVCADGSYFAPKDLPTPDMPQQRALLIHNDGTETLVVESAVSSKSGDLAWIVPVPSKPTEVSAATYGTVATLPEVMGPEWMYPDTQLLEFGAVSLLIVLVVAAIELKRRRVPPHTFVLESLLLLVIWFLAFSMLFAALGSGPIDELAGWSRIGNLESAIVGSQSPSEVIAWLKDNGFAVSQQQADVIAAESKAGWWFVVTRASGGQGAASPQPLKIVFKTDKSIYPMQLTSVGRDSVYLDLVVASDHPVAARGMTSWQSSEWAPVEPLTEHPEIAKLLKTRMVVTRMTGKLTGDALKHDLLFRSEGSIGKRMAALPGAIVTTVSTWTLIAASLALIIATYIALQNDRRFRWALFFGLALPMALGVEAWLVMSRTVPTIPDAKNAISRYLKGGAALWVAKDWAKDIDDEEKYEAEYERSARISDPRDSGWGKDVPGGVVRAGDQVIAFSYKGNPTYFKIGGD
ncbi:MAG TPA: DUF2330 domain-containing protein [Fimbriimonadaceae bacterium]|nr:DUF2330 domain-containing protein [Fimbriimonadaceae bacterium]